MSSKSTANVSGQSGGGSSGSNNSSGQTGQANTGKSSGGQHKSGWQAGYERAYADAINGVNNGETWGYAGGSDRFGQGYMRGHQETYGDK